MGIAVELAGGPLGRAGVPGVAFARTGPRLRECPGVLVQTSRSGGGPRADAGGVAARCRGFRDWRRRLAGVVWVAGIGALALRSRRSGGGAAAAHPRSAAADAGADASRRPRDLRPHSPDLAAVDGSVAKRLGG